MGRSLLERICSTAMHGRTVALTLVLAIAAIAPSMAAGQAPTGTITKPTATPSGTITMTVTLPHGGAYAQEVVSGRTVLCRVKRTFESAGTRRVACRVRTGALKAFRKAIAGKARTQVSATLDAPDTTQVVYALTVSDWIFPSSS